MYRPGLIQRALSFHCSYTGRVSNMGRVGAVTPLLMLMGPAGDPIPTGCSRPHRGCGVVF